MDTSRNIFAWLGQREEKEILTDALAHGEKSLECVRELKEALDAFFKSDRAGKEKAIANIKAAEHQGDELRRKMMEELSRGILLPPDREDLMLLNESLNDIADRAKSAARLLEFMEKPTEPELIAALVEDCLIGVKAAERLQNAISSLIKGIRQKTLEDCAQIETLEEEGDDKKRELLGLLMKSGLSGPSMLLIYELIDTVETLIDDIDQAGDLVRILAIKA